MADASRMTRIVPSLMAMVAAIVLALYLPTGCSTAQSAGPEPPTGSAPAPASSAADPGIDPLTGLPRLLDISDLPRSWVPTVAAPGGIIPPCLEGDRSIPAPTGQQVVAYARLRALPALQELVFTYRGKDAAVAIDRIANGFATCPDTTIVITGVRVPAHYTPLSIGELADGSRGFTAAVHDPRGTYTVDVALIHKRQKVAILVYADRTGSQTGAQFQRFAAQAADKL